MFGRGPLGVSNCISKMIHFASVFAPIAALLLAQIARAEPTPADILTAISRNVHQSETKPESELRAELKRLRIPTPEPSVPPEGETDEEKRTYYDRIKPLFKPYWEKEQARTLALASACQQLIDDFPTVTDVAALETEMAEAYIRALMSSAADNEGQARQRIDELLSRPDLKPRVALPFYRYQLNMISIMGRGGTLDDEILPVPTDRDKIPVKTMQLVEKFAARFPNSPELGALSFAAARYLDTRQRNDASQDLRVKYLEQAEKLGNEETRQEVELLRFREGAVGKSPPPVVFTAEDGRKIDLNKFRGKVVLLDFWATWCGPCVEKIPKIKRLYENHHSKGLEVIGISLDESHDKLDEFVSKNDLHWPEFFDGKGWQNEISDRFGVRSIPDVWLIDREGRVAAVNPNELEKTIVSLLGGN